MFAKPTFRHGSELTEAHQRAVAEAVPDPTHLMGARKAAIEASAAMGGQVTFTEPDILVMAQILAAASTGHLSGVDPETTRHPMWLATESYILQGKNPTDLHRAAFSALSLSSYRSSPPPSQDPFARLDALLQSLMGDGPARVGSLKVRLVSDTGEVVHEDVRITRTANERAGSTTLETWTLDSGESFKCYNDRRLQFTAASRAIGHVRIGGSDYNVMYVSAAD